MTFIDAIILGIVEGLTEFLPISSTGHMVIAADILRLVPSEFLKTFQVVIQLGAIGAVLMAYGRTLFTRWDLLKRVAVAFVPTAILGLLFYKIIKQLLGDPAVTLWALGVGGILLIIFEWWYHEPADAHEDLATIPYRTAFLVGLAQSFAMIPGVSRAAATICGGLALGLSRRAIVEFSFLLAIPTMAAATGLDLVKNAGSFSGNQWYLLLVGFIVAWGIASLTIKWLLAYIKKHDFTVFGIYRIIIAVLFGLIL